MYSLHLQIIEKYWWYVQLKYQTPNRIEEHVNIQVALVTFI